MSTPSHARHVLLMLLALVMFTSACRVESEPAEMATQQSTAEPLGGDVTVEDVTVQDITVQDVAVQDVAVQDVAVEDVAVEDLTVEEITAEAIVEATLANDVIEFEASMHVSGWTELAAEGRLFPAEGRAEASTFFTELGEHSLDLLELRFEDGQSLIWPVDGQRSDARIGDEGLAEVLFTIDSFAEGEDLQEFFLDILSQAELRVVDDDIFSDSALTRLIDADPDDDVVIEVSVDNRLRLRRIDLRRPDLEGERFEQWANFRYPLLEVEQTGPPADLADPVDAAAPRVVTEDMGACARFQVVYTTRLDFRAAIGAASRDDALEYLGSFSDAYVTTINEYEVQQTLREAGLDDAYRQIHQLESALAGHLWGGTPLHAVDFSDAEAAVDRLGVWVRELCPEITPELTDLPDIAPLLVGPSAETIEAGRKSFCPALLDIFVARDAFRSYGDADNPPAMTPEAERAFEYFLSTVDRALQVHRDAGFVTADPRLNFNYGSTMFERIEIQARHVLFAPGVPTNETVLRVTSEFLEPIEEFARIECAGTVLNSEPYGPIFDSDEIAIHYGDSHEAAFCHRAEQELLLRRAWRAQLEALQAGDQASLENATLLLQRMVNVARGSRNNYHPVFEDEGTGYSRGWWLVSTIEWVITTPLPEPGHLPSVDRHERPWEPSHDPAPTERTEQIALIRENQPERDQALQNAADLCGFDQELLVVGDDVALLERLWKLREGS